MLQSFLLHHLFSSKPNWNLISYRSVIDLPHGGALLNVALNELVRLHSSPKTKPQLVRHIKAIWRQNQTLRLTWTLILLFTLASCSSVIWTTTDHYTPPPGPRSQAHFVFRPKRVTVIMHFIHNTCFIKLLYSQGLKLKEEIKSR